MQGQVVENTKEIDTLKNLLNVTQPAKFIEHSSSILPEHAVPGTLTYQPLYFFQGQHQNNVSP